MMDTCSPRFVGLLQAHALLKLQRDLGYVCVPGLIRVCWRLDYTVPGQCGGLGAVSWHHLALQAPS